MTEHLIWNPDTGITDLEGNPELLSASQIPGIRAVWTDQKKRLEGSEQLKDFIERLSREWAIETGVIENLYDIERGITQTLIEHGFQEDFLVHGSTNKSPSYVIQLLRDQKDALDGIFDFVKESRHFSTSYIKELHQSLLQNQTTTEARDEHGNFVQTQLVRGAWKTQENYPERDGVVYKYCPPEHVAAEMDRLVKMHNELVELEVPGEVQAAWLHHRFTQIHPFQDGNGRVARAIASLVLVKDGLFPLVVTREDKRTYITALERADSGDLSGLIDLITRLQVTQFRKATAISEALLVEEDVQAALIGLSRAAIKIAAERRELFKGVFEHAYAIENDLHKRLTAISSQVENSLKSIMDDARVFAIRSEKANDYYFRAEIIRNAKKHIGYFADTSEYRSWVALKMQWSRGAELVFTVHGIGKPFNGSLICAPFLKFKDTDDDNETRHTFVPIAEEGFVFFYNEAQEKLLERFLHWRENILKVALKELTQNL